MRLATTGKLDELVNRDFGSLEELKKRMNAAAAGIQGSGWAWLVRYHLLCPTSSSVYVADLLIAFRFDLPGR